MRDKDQIKDLFSEKLGNYEAKVNPDLWANVASQVGTSATGAAGGMSLLTKAIIGISGAAVLTTGVILWKGSDEEPTSSKEPTKKEIPAVSENEQTKDIVEVENTDPVVSSVENENAPTFIENSAVPSVENQSGTDTNPNGGDKTSENNSTTPNSTDVDLKPEVEDPKEKLDDDKAIATIKEAQKKDSVVLANAHNVATEDEPLKDIPSNQEVAEVEEVIALEIPDVFTPDGNGINDDYYLINVQTEFKQFEFVIYDKTGKMVMLANEPDFKWTGIDPTTGTTVPKGRYAYVLVAQTEKGKSIKKTGVITVQ